MSGNQIISRSLLLACLTLFSCGSSPDKSTHTTAPGKANPVGYDLSNPDRKLTLPPVLFEISGIAVIDSVSVACIQDENGVVFVYDLEKNDIRDYFTFHYPGDYEGIADIGGAFYVLRSDGTLFETRPHQSPDSTRQIPSTGVPSAEYEGLCYDSRYHRLLIVPKNKPGKEYGDRKKQPVYGLDPGFDDKGWEKVLDFDFSGIAGYSLENNIKLHGNKDEINLRISDIAIHPLTDMLFAISAVNRIICVFNRDGSVHYIEKLDPELFNLPEGISFHENGDMLISNEGGNNYPTILLFKYQNADGKIPD